MHTYPLVAVGLICVRRRGPRELAPREWGSSFGVVAVTVGVAVPGTFWGCGFAGVLQVMVGDVVTI